MRPGMVLALLLSGSGAPGYAAPVTLAPTTPIYPTPAPAPAPMRLPRLRPPNPVPARSMAPVMTLRG